MWPINYSRKEEIKSSGQKCDAVRYYSPGLMETTFFGTLNVDIAALRWDAIVQHLISASALVPLTSA